MSLGMLQTFLLVRIPLRRQQVLSGATRERVRGAVRQLALSVMITWSLTLQQVAPEFCGVQLSAAGLLLGGLTRRIHAVSRSVRSLGVVILA